MPRSVAVPAWASGCPCLARVGSEDNTWIARPGAALSALFLGLFAFLGTWIVARYGFRHDRSE